MGNSKDVKNWRIRTKERIIESMGGCCQICGYNKCDAALELHHIDPKEKEFSFGSMRANPKAWKTIVKELRKCVLLCANCHREIHNSAITLPTNYKKFDENFVDYKEVRELDICPVCKIRTKPKGNKTCSYACAGKLTGKMDWDNINLEQLMDEYDCNFSQLGKLLGCSDNAVRKRAIKLNLWL